MRQSEASVSLLLLPLSDMSFQSELLWQSWFDFWLSVSMCEIDNYVVIRFCEFTALQCLTLKLLHHCVNSFGFWCMVTCTNLVDPASSHMLVSKIKPCMSQ